jgi:hypothetical protein
VLPTVLVTDVDGTMVFAQQSDDCRVHPTPETSLAALRRTSATARQLT